MSGPFFSSGSCRNGESNLNVSLKCTLCRIPVGQAQTYLFAMSIVSQTPPSAPLFQRVLFAIPVLGWIARDVTHGDENNIYFAIVALVSLWGISTLTFGLPGLYLPALALVPVCFFMLIWISLGREK